MISANARNCISDIIAWRHGTVDIYCECSRNLTITSFSSIFRTLPPVLINEWNPLAFGTFPEVFVTDGFLSSCLKPCGKLLNLGDFCWSEIFRGSSLFSTTSSLSSVSKWFLFERKFIVHVNKLFGVSTDSTIFWKENFNSIPVPLFKQQYFFLRLYSAANLSLTFNRVLCYSFVFEKIISLQSSNFSAAKIIENRVISSVSMNYLVIMRSSSKLTCSKQLHWIYGQVRWRTN